MKTIFEAANTVEAHMILHLLEQQGISGRIEGEFLQGAIGELPAAGMIRVLVSDEDYDAARAIVDGWDKAQPAATKQVVQPRKSSRLLFLMCGLLIGVLGTFLYFRAPLISDGVDFNGDGVIDDHWTYAKSGLPLKNEVDRNLDRKADYVTTFGRDGLIESGEMDDDFDGTFESKATFRQGNVELIETDTDGDRYCDLRTNFVSGVLVSTEFIYPTTGLPQRIEYFKLGKRTKVETDTNLDGTLDQRTNYDGIGNVVSTSAIK